MHGWRYARQGETAPADEEGVIAAAEEISFRVATERRKEFTIISPSSMLVERILIAVATIFIPCALIILLAGNPVYWSERTADAVTTTDSEIPSGYYRRLRSLSFDIADDGSETMVTMGTPPKPIRMTFSGTDCGIVVWGHGAPDTYSWVSASPGIHSYGADFFVIGGKRVLLPLRFVSRDDYYSFSADDGIQGIIGACPSVATEIWGLDSATYSARCTTLEIGLESFSSAECSSVGLASPAHGRTHEWQSEKEPWTGRVRMAPIRHDDVIENGTAYISSDWVIGKWTDVDVDVLGPTTAAMLIVPTATRPSFLPWGGRDGKTISPKPHVVRADGDDDIAPGNASARLRTMTWDNTVSVPQILVPESGGSAIPLVGGADCTALATVASSGNFDIFPCIPCYRSRDMVVLSLLVVSALAAVWTALAAIPGMTRPTSRVVALGLSLASACLYMAAAFGSDAGKVIASAASIPRQVAEIAFLLSIIPLVGIGSFLHALDSLSSRRATAEPVRARPCATTRERVLVEIPLVAAFWYIAHAHTNFFARMLLCVGSSMACSMFATEGAITATLLRERWWWIYCVLASWINVLTLRITGLPIAAAFFGGAFPLRIIYFAAFLVLIGYPALLLGTQRAAALAEYARTWGSADDKRKRNGTNSEQTKPVE